MINCEFTYNDELLKKITKASTKLTNMITEIMLGIIIISSAALFATKETVTGIIFAVVAVLTVVAQIISNRRLYKLNSFLLNQKVKLQFDVKGMKYVQTMADEVLQDANIEYAIISKVKQVNDLMFLYFNSRSALIVPRTAFKSYEEYKKAYDLASNNYVA